ncbi:TlpA family protein disulfide reductase [Salinarchaeum laminariae]|uniref:TlpA family protein disulfide reductase n=1 Tax=Salinarchaeum laminariae TaxID=869888 RepID=UPI0020BFFBE1|nr:thioredoxin family protein [Salinarchaeum laminariae]
MSLETMQPTPTWSADAHEETVDTLSAIADEITVKVWGGDWCKDCRAALPDFAAALEAAEVPEDAIEHYSVEKDDDGSKIGPKVEEYGIEYIPTIVIEREGEELVRFVEEEDVPAAIWLADRLRESEQLA